MEYNQPEKEKIIEKESLEDQIDESWVSRATVY